MESTDLQRVNFEEGYVAVIDKPYRWSSTDVVRKVKFELRKAGYRRIKVGHAGTLRWPRAFCWSASDGRPSRSTPCRPSGRST